MRVVTWTLRLAVFLLLAAFAAKNADPVTLRFYFDLAFTAPLVVLLLGFFVAGALFGMLALLGTVLRQRRDIGALKRQAATTTVVPPPPPL